MHSLCGMDRHVTYTQGRNHHHHPSLPLPPPTHTTTTTTRLEQVCVALWSPFPSSFPVVDIMSHVERASGAAKRRRERRLRQFLRHERLIVAMALAENLHHSRQKVEGDTYEGPRAQKTVRAIGALPRVLEYPAPQGGAATVGFVAGASPHRSCLGWWRRSGRFCAGVPRPTGCSRTGGEACEGGGGEEKTGGEA